MLEYSDYSEKITSTNKPTRERQSKSQGHPTGNLKNFGLSYLAQNRAFNGFKRAPQGPMSQSPPRPDQYTTDMQPGIIRTEVVTLDPSRHHISRPDDKKEPRALYESTHQERRDAIKPDHIQQLYKGEKTRNQLLTKQVNDLKQQIESMREEIKELRKIRATNNEYQQLILKYEEQSRIREEEYENMQTAVRHKVEELEQQSQGLEYSLADSQQQNQQLINQLDFLSGVNRELEQSKQVIKRLENSNNQLLSQIELEKQENQIQK